MLSRLFDHLYAPAHRLEHPWRRGDFIIWDNYTLQHARPDVAGVTRRRLQRASVAERSLVEQLPEFFQSRAAPHAANSAAY